MKIPGLSAKNSAIVTIALLFFIVANPMVFRFVDSLLGWLVGPIASPSGCPTTLGLVVHSVVFALLLVCVVRA
jgi:uncharacterized membrane protein (DUF106 family)